MSVFQTGAESYRKCFADGRESRGGRETTNVREALASDVKEAWMMLGTS
jgi:hypothetical protein